MKSLLALASCLIFFSPTIQIKAATIIKVSKARKATLEIAASSNELKGIRKGSRVKAKVSDEIMLRGVVKGVKGKKFQAVFPKHKADWSRLKKGKRIKISSIDKSIRLTKRNPYKLSYIAHGSERTRMKKSFSLDLEGGTAIAPVPAIGITLGSFLTQNMLVELNLAIGEASSNQSVVPGQLELKKVQRTENVILRLKKFWGNSFYTNSGVGARRSNITGVSNLDPEITGYTQGQIYSKSRADAVFEFSIGNRWQLSSFNIGADWLGLMAPISKIRLPNDGNNLEGGSAATSGAIAAENETLNSSVLDEKFDKELGTTFSSKFYVGYSF